RAAGSLAHRGDTAVARLGSSVARNVGRSLRTGGRWRPPGTRCTAGRATDPVPAVRAAAGGGRAVRGVWGRAARGGAVGWARDRIAAGGGGARVDPERTRCAGRRM